MTIESTLRDCPPDTLIGARNMAHRAVQPPTRAARANIAAVPDASHTNMIWDDARGAFLSNPMTSGGDEIVVGLVLSNLTLVVVRAEATLAVLGLSGVSVEDADVWLDSQLVKLGFKPATSVIHPYEIPTAVTDITIYSSDGLQSGLAALAGWFRLTDHVLRAFAANNRDIKPGPSPVRCWPHHFDIATYVALEGGDGESARGIGVGLSPGDEGYEQPYFYVNPWPHLDPNDLPELPGLGHWHRDGFVGAILTGDELLPAADLTEGTAGFIAEAFAIGRGKLGL